MSATDPTPPSAGAGREAGRIRALSRDRNFGLLWGGEVLSEVGSQVTTIAMPLLVLALTGSAAKAGLVGVARTIAFPISALPAGVLADRVDRRRLMVACACARLVAMGSVALVLAVGRPPLAQLLLVALVDALLYSTSYVAERGLLGEIVAPESFADAVTLNEGRSAAAVVVGPPLGGALFGLAQALPFVTDAASFVAVILSLLGLRVPARRRPAGPASARGLRGAWDRALEGLRWLWHEPFLRAGSLLYAVANVTFGAFELLGVLILRHHGASSAAIGGAYALAGAGGLAGAVIAGPLRRRLSVRWAVLAEPWCDTLLLPLLLVLHGPAEVGAVLALLVAPMTLSSSVIVGRRLTLTPDELRGRVQAGATLMSTTLSWLGPLAMGILVQYAGVDAAVLTLFGWSLATALGATMAPAFRGI